VDGGGDVAGNCIGNVAAAVDQTDNRCRQAGSGAREREHQREHHKYSARCKSERTVAMA